MRDLGQHQGKNLAILVINKTYKSNVKLSAIKRTTLCK